jgi:hypothetical protein
MWPIPHVAGSPPWPEEDDSTQLADRIVEQAPSDGDEPDEDQDERDTAE